MTTPASTPQRTGWHPSPAPQRDGILLDVVGQDDVGNPRRFQVYWSSGLLQWEDAETSMPAADFSMWREAPTQ